jgi:hypothetical protein
MTLDIASQAHPDVSALDQIMAEEQRFGKPPDKWGVGKTAVSADPLW